jgi:hypothetical protein
VPLSDSTDVFPRRHQENVRTPKGRRPLPKNHVVYGTCDSCAEAGPSRVYEGSDPDGATLCPKCAAEVAWHREAECPVNGCPTCMPPLGVVHAPGECVPTAVYVRLRQALVQAGQDIAAVNGESFEPLRRAAADQARDRIAVELSETRC